MNQNNYFSISVNAAMACEIMSVCVCNDASICSVSLVPVWSYGGFPWATALSGEWAGRLLYKMEIMNMGTKGKMNYLEQGWCNTFWQMIYLFSNLTCWRSFCSKIMARCKVVFWAARLRFCKSNQIHFPMLCSHRITSLICHRRFPHVEFLH
jgi:hypothetical protein